MVNGSGENNGDDAICRVAPYLCCAQADTSVTECVFDGDHASVHLSYNTGYTNARLPDDVSRFDRRADS